MRIALVSLSALALVLGLAACDAAGPGGPSADPVSVRFVVDGDADVSYSEGASSSQTATATGRWEHRFEAEPGAELTLAAVSRSGQPITARATPSRKINQPSSAAQKGAVLSMNSALATVVLTTATMKPAKANDNDTPATMPLSAGSVR